MSRRWKGSASPDSGIRPGSIRDRALRAVIERGPTAENPEKLKASHSYWRASREGQTLLARAERESVPLGRPPSAEIVIKKTALPMPGLAVVITKITDRFCLRPFAVFVLDDTDGVVSELESFATVAAALLQHDRRGGDRVNRRSQTTLRKILISRGRGAAQTSTWGCGSTQPSSSLRRTTSAISGGNYAPGESGGRRHAAPEDVVVSEGNGSNILPLGRF